MEVLKDGKYVIGFLIGVICSFVIMGGIKGNQTTDELAVFDDTIAGENQVAVGENGGELQVETNLPLENGQISPSSAGEEAVATQQSSQVTKPEDPHSPELQRLALILRETERMINRLKKDVRSVEIKQQTATLLNQN